jgi:hypothetical protein
LYRLVSRHIPAQNQPGFIALHRMVLLFSGGKIWRPATFFLLDDKFDWQRTTNNE